MSKPSSFAKGFPRRLPFGRIQFQPVMKSILHNFFFFWIQIILLSVRCAKETSLLLWLTVRGTPPEGNPCLGVTRGTLLHELVKPLPEASRLHTSPVSCGKLGSWICCVNNHRLFCICWLCLPLLMGRRRRTAALMPVTFPLGPTAVSCVEVSLCFWMFVLLLSEPFHCSSLSSKWKDHKFTE